MRRHQVADGNRIKYSIPEKIGEGGVIAKEHRLLGNAVFRLSSPVLLGGIYPSASATEVPCREGPTSGLPRSLDRVLLSL
jgi:hypothetical protein